MRTISDKNVIKFLKHDLPTRNFSTNEVIETKIAPLTKSSHWNFTFIEDKINVLDSELKDQVYEEVFHWL